jgi:hypothetical protein
VVVWREEAHEPSSITKAISVARKVLGVVIATSIVGKFGFATGHYTQKPTPVVEVGFSKAVPKRQNGQVIRAKLVWSNLFFHYP